jgi:putative ABC transport system permease protein
MHFHDVLKVVWESFRTNKIRSFLTILGIVIGIGSVIVIVSLGAGAQDLILNQIESVGSNLVGVLPGASDEEGIPAGLFGITITTLKYEDALALNNKNLVPNVTAACAYVKGIDTISSKNESITGDFMGVSANYVEVEDSEIQAGRFFTLSEEKGLARVAVLGSERKIDLFGDEDPIGQSIKIKRESFEVIGVLAERGTSLLSDQDIQVFVPVLTAQKLLLGIKYLGFIRAKVDREENVPYAVENIKTTLRHRHSITNPADDDFTVRDTTQALDILGSVTDALRFFLAGIAALSLVVGGVGIMNIMLIAVTERTREIGLRKALGARKRDLLTQFLTEASVMSLIGGIVGVLGGIGFSALIAVVASFLGFEWAFIVSPFSIIMACVVAISIGLIFGYYPAKRAAGLDPIQALRYE